MRTFARIGTSLVVTAVCLAVPATAASASPPAYEVYCVEVLPDTVPLPMVCVVDPLS